MSKEHINYKPINSPENGFIRSLYNSECTPSGPQWKERQTIYDFEVWFIDMVKFNAFMHLFDKQTHERDAEFSKELDNKIKQAENEARLVLKTIRRLVPC